MWANIAKVVAISGTVVLSYLGMRIWVFAGTTRRGLRYYTGIAMKQHYIVADKSVMHRPSQLLAKVQEESELIHVETNVFHSQDGNEQQFLTHHSLSVVLPAHNEEAVIATTLHVVLSTLPLWVQNFEVIVVIDGSTDNTWSIVQTIAATDPRVRLITHPFNQSYGATLVTGFTAVTKDIAFFMDADGQFDLHDLEPFFPSLTLTMLCLAIALIVRLRRYVYAMPGRRRGIIPSGKTWTTSFVQPGSVVYL